MPFEKSRFVSPDRGIRLPAQTVDVWRLNFNELIGALDTFRFWLSADELERARKFHFEEDRQRYILTHGALRNLLAGYLNYNPKEIELSRSEFGKPSIVESMGDENICFNLAHSNDLALFAFAHDAAIGVDIEWERTLEDMRLIARRFFAPAEYDAWEEVGEGLKEHAFYLAWTRKEAFVKAIGEGLTYPLDRFQATLDPYEPARLISIDGDAVAAKEWTLHDIQVGKGYSAALVVAGGGHAIRYWQYRRDWMANQPEGD